MRRRTVAAAVVLAAVATWGFVEAFDSGGVPGVGDLPDDVSSVAASSRLGACGEPYQPDVSAADFLAEAERWFEVLDVGGLPEQLSYDSYVGFSATAQPVLAGAKPAGQPSAMSLRVWGATIPGLEWATRANGRAFVALASEGRVSETVLYALIQHPDGEFFFAGECQERFLTDPLRSRLAGRYNDAMRAVVGTVARDRILELVDALPAPTPTVSPADRIVNPGSMSRAELDLLMLIGVELEIPEQWTGAGTVCSRSPAGWNDCLDLASPRSSGSVRLTAYLDESRMLEIWLLNESGDVRAPIQRLGQLDLTAESKREGPAGLSVRIRLAGEIRRQTGQTPQVVGSRAELA